MVEGFVDGIVGDEGTELATFPEVSVETDGVVFFMFDFLEVDCLQPNNKILDKRMFRMRIKGLNLFIFILGNLLIYINFGYLYKGLSLKERLKR